MNPILLNSDKRLNLKKNFLFSKEEKNYSFCWSFR